MPQSRSIRKSLLANMMLAAAGAVAILAVLWIWQEYARFGRDLAVMHARLTAAKQGAVKKQVDDAIGYIEYKRSQTEARTRETIKDQANEACAVAMGLYEKYKDQKSIEEIRSLVREALRPVRYHDGRGYYFALNMDGVAQLYPTRPGFEGRNLLTVKDSRGRYPIQEEIELVRKQSEGFISYTWQRPEANARDSRKIGYVKYVAPLDWIIGTGEYLDDVEKDMQREALDWLARMKVGNDGYVFAGQWDGLSLLGPARGQNMADVTNADGAKVVQELIEKARAGGGFVSYVMPKLENQRPAPKMSYARSVDDWKWYVGAGVYVDDIDGAIAQEQVGMRDRMRASILYILCALAVLLAASYLMSRRMANKTEAAFGAFSSFFERAATESAEMAVEGLNFSEFESLAVSANRMIRERKAAEAAVRQSEARYRLLFNSGGDAVFVHEGPGPDGLPGRFIEANDAACTRLGYSREELLTMRPTDIDDPSTVAGVPSALEKVKNDGFAMWEGAHMTKDGRRINVEITNHMFDLDGKPTILSMVRDVTERKQAEEERARLEAQLRHSQKMEAIGQLAGGVAHDFNNLLQVVEGYTEMAIAGLTQGDVARADLLEVKKASRRAASLTRQLLTFGRREASAPECLDVTDVISNMTKMLRRVIGEQIELVMRTHGAAKPVYADPGQLEQILMNLAINARDAMPKGGNITIETGNFIADDAFRARHPEAIDREYVLVSMSDTGVGIAPEMQERIFEPFFTTKEVGAGTGLGLATVYAIVKRQGGVIEVKSEAGRGSTFDIYLLTASGMQTVLHPRAEEPDVRGGDETILVAEDDEAVRDLTVEILERAGYSLLVARNGEEAIDIAREREARFDMALLDIVMPKKGGREVRDTLKAVNPQVPVLFSSGYSYTDTEGAVSKDEEHIQKPYAPQDLLRKVREILDRPRGGSN